MGRTLYTENRKDFKYISHHLLFIVQGMDVKDKKPQQNTSGIGMWQLTPCLMPRGFVMFSNCV